jgi:indole-3-glycerol phosphate synthase
MTASLLQTIVAATRRAVVERETLTPLASLRAEATAAGARQSFKAALEAPSAAPRIIAECKRRSPSKGMLREAYDPAAIARGYQSSGAAAISVLTEPAFFDGALDHLAAVRAAVTIPVLRKDFIVSRYQIAEARAAGADAVLLIVAALDQTELVELLAAADDYGLDALVEVHDAREVDRASAAGARVIGVNSRNLHTLQVDPKVFMDLAARIPPGVLGVAESGIRDAASIVALRANGYRAFLIGERFMSASDSGAALRSLLSACMTEAAEERSGVQGTPPEIK